MDAKLKNAMSTAVEAIYFADASDFRTALWKIVGVLGDDAAVNLLEADERAAYEKFCRS